jgi:tetratricopeptide (TPR) repeat protein
LERLAVAQSHLAQALAKSLTEDDAASLETISGGFQAALATLDELIVLFPDVPRYQNEAAHVAYHYAWFLHQQGDAGAEAMFQSARDRWVEMAENRDVTASERLAWLLITCPLDSVREFDRAVAIAKEAWERVPDNSRLQCTLALSLRSQEELDAAASVLTNVLAESARSGRESFAVAELRFEQGDHEAAAAARQQGIEWFDSQAPGVHDYGLLKSRLADLDTN